MLTAKPLRPITRDFVIEPNHIFTATLCTFLNKNKTPVNILTWVFKLGATAIRGADANAVEFTMQSGLSKEGASVKLAIPASVVNQHTGQVLFYDLRVTRPGMNVWYVLEGKLQFNERITR